MKKLIAVALMLTVLTCACAALAAEAEKTVMTHEDFMAAELDTEVVVEP